MRCNYGRHKVVTETSKTINNLRARFFKPTGTADLGVKMEKNSGVIKGRFYMTTSLSDSWEAFTPLHGRWSYSRTSW